MNNIELFTTYGEFCEWANTSYLIISENVFDPLIYYSHILPILLALPLALIVFARAPQHRLNRYLMLLVGLFSLWALFDLILWAHADAQIIMFFWSMLILLEPLIYLTALIFAYFALYQKQLPTWCLSTFLLLLLPIVALLPTTLAIESFNLTNCWREVTEGPLVFYGYLYQILVALTIITFFVRSFMAKKTVSGHGGRFLVVGILLFLLMFSFGNIVGSFTEDWTIGQYGLFGMPLMVGFLAFVIARFQAFESKILGAEMSVGALGILLLSLLLVENLQLLRTIVLFSFGFYAAIGFLLIRAVRSEVHQRKQLEDLTSKLEKANKRLKILDQMKSEFVSIASHQLRSPLTSIRGYASMLLEGSYGKLSQKAQEAVERISESSRYMALSVEDYLNVSRIQAGNMKYEYSEFDLAEMASGIVDDIRREAIKKGLVLSFASQITTKSVVRADKGKTMQIIHNLINNALKYTPQGTIVVSVRDDKKQLLLEVTDTGIGMSAETIEAVFGKFERAKNANEVNVTGTGLGLYVAQKMAQEMGGDIEASSPGEGRGSTFRFIVPIAK